MSAKELHMSTKLLHSARASETDSGAMVTPIYQNSAFAYDSADAIEAVFAGRQAGYVYSRMGNPTLTQLERNLTVLEDGLGAISTSSGMAAITSTVLALAESGDEIVSGNSIFGGTYSLLHSTLARSGIKTRFVESTDVEAFRKAITDRTKLVFVETIGNPKLDVPDISEIAKVAHEKGIALAVDNTITPSLFQPKKAGADIVIHSTTKFINGHGNAIGGAIIDTGIFDWAGKRYQHLDNIRKRSGNFAFLAFLRSQIFRDTGGCQAPFNAFLTSIGIESLVVRMERHTLNAIKVARFFASDKRIVDVRYPGLETHPDHKVAGRQFENGYGALLTLSLKDRESCFKFINGLKRARNAANIGDVRTLVIHPASTFCRELTGEERQAVGVSDNLIRFSIGIEHVDDIISDIDVSLYNI